jgi:hypothetical protein
MPRWEDAGFGDADSSLVEAILVDGAVEDVAERSASLSDRGQPVAATSVAKKTAAAAVAFRIMHYVPVFADVFESVAIGQSSTTMY